MKIKPIINYSSHRNITFKAKMSNEVWNGLDFLDFETSQIYGTDSQEYKTFNKLMKNIISLCPKEKIVIYTKKDKQGLEIYSFGLKKFLRKARLLTCRELYKDDLFSKENMKRLEKALTEEDKKQAVENCKS